MSKNTNFTRDQADEGEFYSIEINVLHFKYKYIYIMKKYPYNTFIRSKVNIFNAKIIIQRKLYNLINI